MGRLGLGLVYIVHGDIHGMGCAYALCVPHRGGPTIVHGTCKGYAIVGVICVGCASRQVVRPLVR